MGESAGLLCAGIILAKEAARPRSDFANSKEGGQDQETYESRSISSEEVGRYQEKTLRVCSR